MGKLFEELKRRNVYRVATGYAVISWLLIQVADTLFPVFAMPDTAIRLLTVFLLIGFFLVLPIAWVFEWTPEGIKKTRSAKPGDSSRIGLADYLFGGVSLLIVGFIVVRLLLPIGSEEAVRSASVETDLLLTEPVEIVVEESPAPNEFSIAVLPLANLSPDPDNAYFAAGIHEEILNQLVKVGQLEVTSRTSVIQFENSGLSIQEIAQELNVGTIMEGSVRFAGNQVRITTQLIRTSDDVHLWSETYQREYEDIFAIQSDVAIQVANALQASLTSSELVNIERPPTNSTEAYSLYLQAKALETDFTTDETQAYDAGIPLLERAIELDPSFAQAYAALAYRVGSIAYFIPERERRLAEFDLGIDLANKAIEIDPDEASAYLVLSRIYWDLEQWDLWLPNARLSVEVPSLGGVAALDFAGTLSQLGLHEAAYHWANVAISKESGQRPSVYLFSATIRAQGRDFESALIFLEQYLEHGGRKDDYHTLRALFFDALGRDEESLNELNQIVEAPFTMAISNIPDYLRCKKTSAREQDLLDIGPQQEAMSHNRLLACALGASDLDRVFELLEYSMQRQDPVVGAFLSMYDEAVLDPRWQAVVEYQGLPQLTAIQIPY